VPRALAVVGLLPEGDEAEHLLRLLALAEICIGIAEGPAVGILGQEDEHAGLPAAAGRDVVPLHHRVRPIVRHGVEVEVERGPGEEIGPREVGVPGGQEPERPRVVQAVGVLGQEALLGADVEPREQTQPLVGHERHDIALALDRPELQGQPGAEGVGRGDHPGPGQAGRRGQPRHVEAHQVGEEKEQAAEARREAPRGEREGPDIRDGLRGRPGAGGPLLVQASGQRGEALGLQDLPDRRRTQRAPGFLQSCADLVDGGVLLAQGDDPHPGRGLLRLRPGPPLGRREEGGGQAAPEVMAEDVEGAHSVAEGPGDLGGGPALDEVGPQRLVLALPRLRRLQEEPAAST